jgi:hypothetical protein
MAQVMLGLLVVIVAACLLFAGIGSLALVISELREAPEGYEDEQGFHVTRGSMIQNTHRPRSFATLRFKSILAGFP